MKIGAVIDSQPVSDTLSIDAPRQLPYVAAIMLTRLSADVRDGFQSRLSSVFDRPTPFTVRGVYAKSATKSSLAAEVYFPESQEDRGVPQREYIRPGTEGAFRRSQKKTEFLLSRLGVLPPGWVTTPGRSMPLDSYGNLSGRIYAQIINVLQLKARVIGGRNVAERSAKRAQKLGVATEFFAVPPGRNKLGKNGSWLPPGVWKHLPGHRLLQVLKFVAKASYKPRFNVKAEAAAIVQKQLPVRWAEAAELIRQKFASGPR